jgi:hypothetical protein
MVDKTNFNAKADDLYAQAEKKLKGIFIFLNIIGGFFKNMMSSKADRMEDARELF